MSRHSATVRKPGSDQHRYAPRVPFTHRRVKHSGEIYSRTPWRGLGDRSNGNYAVGVLTAPIIVTVAPTPNPTVLQACAQVGCPTSPDAENGRTVTYACISRNYCPARY